MQLSAWERHCFLPIITVEDKKLFAMLRTNHGISASSIMSVWSNYADRAKGFFPKLEVYFRAYLDKWGEIRG